MVRQRWIHFWYKKMFLIFDYIDIPVHTCICVLHENVTSLMSYKEFDDFYAFFEKRGHVVLHLSVVCRPSDYYGYMHVLKFV